MSRFSFAALALGFVARATAAQQVPGRDLLEFPLGLLAEAPALSRMMPVGLWNPATTVLPAGDRGTAGVASLSTPNDQAVKSTLLGASARLPRGLTGFVSVATSSVADIFKTETDPQTFGSELAYGTTLVSLGAAKRVGLTSYGVAARYRTGTLDIEHRSATSVDAGVVVDSVFGTRARIAASTFLFSPSRQKEAATYLLALDVPIVHEDSVWSARAGYSLAKTDARGREDYVFATARYRRMELAGGLVRTSMFANESVNGRIGLGLHYARYAVAIAREDGTGGLGASYQFLLTTVFR